MISVCIPTFNGAEYIKEQLDSILSQLSLDDEVIISDDGSTDKTIDIIRSMNDPRIKFFTHDKIVNPYKGHYKAMYYVYRNIENALSHASGDYIFLSDQDDIWLSNKVEKVISKFKEGFEIVLHNNTVIDNEHNVLMKSYFTFTNPSNSTIRMIARCFIQGASLAFTKQVKDWSLPFPNNPISHDHWIAYNSFFRGYKIGFIYEPLLLYRRHGQNVSSSSEKSTNPLWFKVSYRFCLLIACLTVLKNRFTGR